MSQVTLVPFYDRTQLIYETIGTLEQALTLEVLITLLVVLVLVMNVRASLLISGMLPLGVLVAFIAMRYWGVQANIVALTGIAIAIGVMVDVSVVFTESILRVREEQAQDSLRGIILLAMREVGPAVITALATTVVSFIPVLLLEGQEGKLFRPLAYTKTFALVAALGLGLVLLPTLFYLLWRKPKSPQLTQYARASAVVLLAGVLSYFQQWGFVLFLGGALVLILIASRLPAVIQRYVRLTGWLLGLSWLVWMLARAWLPLGAQVSLLGNMVFTALLVGGILGLSAGFVRVYPQILRWCLRHKGVFLLVPALVMVWGLLAWQGFRVGPDSWRDSFLAQAFPGLGSEFMPTLDEGAFLYMPTTMPHSGVEENLRAIRSIDRRLAAIPEVEVTVGKWGRVNSALDPAPISMFETVIQYTPEYSTDARGRRIRYAVDDDGNYLLKEGGSYPAQAATAPNPEELVEDSEGKYLRLWRPQIQSPDDIWAEVMQVAQWPGLTSAPKLQPIATRLVMLQTGMRSPFGVKVFAPNLEVLSQTLKELEGHLKEVPGIKPETVFADQVVGKPYLEIEWDRFALARYGLTIAEAQAFLAGAIGGQPITYSVEGRERYAVRVRYARDFREDPAQLKESLVSVPVGGQVALSELAEVRFVRGPQSLRSEDTFLVGYVLFDKQPSLAEGEVVLQAEYHLQALQAQGVWAVPTGVRYSFAGTYQQQVRANQRLAVIIPICLVVIFLILYLQFRSATVSAMVFGGIAVAFAGGFVALWAYGRPGFLDLNVVGISLREVFQIHPVNLSVAVWVGFIALFGIATDDGVLMATQLRRRFQSATMDSPEEIRAAVVEAGTRRIRPAMMTTTTTLIALLPVLTSPGRGAEIMVPMAIPTFGGMVFQVMTVFIVPVLFAGWQEARLWMQNRKGS
ncbi:MAG TPA: cation transporter [Cytophagales bacterium]|nr:cation transporter [Cytophagales bacterium]